MLVDTRGKKNVLLEFCAGTMGAVLALVNGLKVTLAETQVVELDETCRARMRSHKVRQAARSRRELVDPYKRYKRYGVTSLASDLAELLSDPSKLEHVVATHGSATYIVVCGFPCKDLSRANENGVGLSGSQSR